MKGMDSNQSMKVTKLQRNEHHMLLMWPVTQDKGEKYVPLCALHYNVCSTYVLVLDHCLYYSYLVSPTNVSACSIPTGADGSSRK